LGNYDDNELPRPKLIGTISRAPEYQARSHLEASNWRIEVMARLRGPPVISSCHRARAKASGRGTPKRGPPQAVEVIKAAPFMWDRVHSHEYREAHKADSINDTRPTTSPIYSFATIYPPRYRIALHHFAATTMAQTIRAAQVLLLLIQIP
jgi:hypothetical protein